MRASVSVFLCMHTYMHVYIHKDTYYTVLLTYTYTSAEIYRYICLSNTYAYTYVTSWKDAKVFG